MQSDKNLYHILIFNLIKFTAELTVTLPNTLRLDQN